MNYFFLKNIISSILANFQCPECSEKSTEQSLTLKKVTDSGLDIVFTCPKCHANAMMRAELGKISPEFLKNNASQKMIIPMKNLKDVISLEQIQEVEDILSKNTTVTDLINGE